MVEQVAPFGGTAAPTLFAFAPGKHRLQLACVGARLHVEQIRIAAEKLVQMAASVSPAHTRERFDIARPATLISGQVALHRLPAQFLDTARKGVSTLRV